MAIDYNHPIIKVTFLYTSQFPLACKCNIVFTIQLLVFRRGILMHQFKQSGFFNLIGNILLLVILIGGITYVLNQNGYGLKITTSSGNNSNGTQSEGFQYTVQVSVTPSEKKAMDLVNDLEVDGFDAYYDTYESDQGHFYKVRVGEYENRRAASAIKTEVKSRYKEYKDSFVKLLSD